MILLASTVDDIDDAPNLTRLTSTTRLTPLRNHTLNDDCSPCLAFVIICATTTPPIRHWVCGSLAGPSFTLWLNPTTSDRHLWSYQLSRNYKMPRVSSLTRLTPHPTSCYLQKNIFITANSSPKRHVYPLPSPRRYRGSRSSSLLPTHLSSCAPTSQPRKHILFL
jgi:hypothetical protein